MKKYRFEFEAGASEIFGAYTPMIIESDSFPERFDIFLERFGRVTVILNEHAKTVSSD